METRQVAEDIRVEGIVQGVGFRPSVYRIAEQYELRGWVLNDGAGVWIRIAGAPEQIESFVNYLKRSPPPLARITRITRTAIPVTSVPEPSFSIAASQTGAVRTKISPDAATCAACQQDLRDPDSRFYRYPFTNCTHCGPRLSIIRAIPYDRHQTSMAAFPMCVACESDYQAIANRRFHAQPIACPACGPQVWLEESDGQVLAKGEAAIARVGSLIRQGEIVAIKGLGGIHLACDTTQETAVAALRHRKHRPAKPFALMVRDLAQLRDYCPVNAAEQQVLESPAAPIVLLTPHPECSLAPSLAPGLSALGFMLPHTPLHHLLFEHIEHPIVLTSGNRSSEPQSITNDEARDLSAIAPYLLLHNRDIINRVDDSVVRVIAGQPQILRRARGYAPAPLPLPPGFEAAPPILAMGSELKTTFCLLRQGEAILSQHLGDLEHPAALLAYQETLKLYLDLFEHQPAAIALDAHPDYRASQLGQRWAAEQQIPVYPIQHHHAHLAAVMVDHHLPIDTPAILGIALDGLGYSETGDLWGGEFLLVDYTDYHRLAHLPPIALLGGAQAMRQPWRNTYAHLRALWTWDDLLSQYGDLPLVQALAAKPRTLLDQMLESGLRSPLATSAGRLFDAVAAAIGCCFEQVTYEGQGAMELEALIGQDMEPNLVNATPYPIDIDLTQTPHQLSFAPLWTALLNDLRQNVPARTISTRFHLGFAQGIAHLAQHLAQTHHLTTVALSGGVFQNQMLLTAVRQQLEQQGLTVLTAQQVPCNDGGLSLGQGAIAAARHLLNHPDAKTS